MGFNAQRPGPSGAGAEALHGSPPARLPFAGVVAATRGCSSLSEYGANRFFRRRAEGVYDMVDLAFRTEKMTDFIRAHRKAHDGAPVYGLGYSNGANILASVIFEAPELFDRVVLMHPLIPWEPEANAALKSLDVLITAGRHDPISPLPLTESLARYLAEQGAKVDLRLHDGGHEVRPQEADFITTFLRRDP
ncbi:dienelactone hydrolase family protein [Bosea sp. (in: a-proteobacteria)]|uniref:alpha/beta hydrolase n=1 Tax=Bosea sp. (in: a-proteobacteria) TaxID=1871050 RepID=UPI0026266382|nr:dienelactone hydrolase family protein [Bosea sp. (in: a-proteobacteria)]MCO5091348.1 alpha/beta hydrolase [Bosea sp. (in: a-proteobacteria)]